MDSVALMQYFVCQRTAMIESLAELVGHESPSAEKDAVDALVALLHGRFLCAGAESSVITSPTDGNRLQVSLAGRETASQNPPVLLLGHVDTVWPRGTVAVRPFRISEGKAWGPGAFDMKAGIVVAQFAFQAIRELGLNLPRPVRMLLTSDEEVGSPGSRVLVERLARESEYVLVLEPSLPDGALKTARKGAHRFVVTAHGRAAHSGIEPENGVSAIRELAHQILRVDALNDLSRGITVNVGRIEGGTGVNVIAPRASAELEIRAWSASELARVCDMVRGLKPVAEGVSIEIRDGVSRPPLERSAKGIELFRRTQSVGQKLGLEIREGSVGGGSDGNFSAALGVPTLDGLGAVGNGAHAETEHVIVDSLPERAALLVALLIDL